LYHGFRGFIQWSLDPVTFWLDSQYIIVGLVARKQRGKEGWDNRSSGAEVPTSHSGFSFTRPYLLKILTPLGRITSWGPSLTHGPFGREVISYPNHSIRFLNEISIFIVWIMPLLLSIDPLMDILVIFHLLNAYFYLFIYLFSFIMNAYF
jgi:hypothetical protein